MIWTRHTRRDWIKQGVGVGLAASFFPSAWSQASPAAFQPPDDRRSDTDALYTEATELAVLRGFAFLHSQYLEEGGFASPRWGKNVAISGLAGLALLGRGYRLGIGTYGKLLESISRFVLKCCQDSGFIESPMQASQGPMYEHGFATLFLAELHGTSPLISVGPSLRRAVELIIRVQNKQGGWRYRPAPADADLSVTVCQIMALRAARNAGLAVPAETIDRAMDYVQRSQNPDGGFMYQLSGGESRFALTAAAVVAMYNAGITSGDSLDSGLEYLQRNYSTIQNPQTDSYFYYAHYYSGQAFWHSGKENWAMWYSRLRDLIVAKQQPDGSWFDNNSAEYGTAMACLILGMPRTVLPIFQR